MKDNPVGILNKKENELENDYNQQKNPAASR